MRSGEPSPGLPSVYCFAHAGGNPREFLKWQADLAGQADLVAIAMPGRAHRFREAAPRDLDEYAGAAARAIAATAGDAPFYLFGHSLGALVAFEVARRLAGTTGLRHLIASGSAAPSLLPSERVKHAATLEGREFAEAIRFFGGLPTEVIGLEDLHALLLANVQVDFRLVASYRYRPAPPLPIGISLLNGADDPHVSAAGLDPWSAESQLPVRQHWSPGGHFYFEDRPRAVCDLISEIVAGDAGAPPAGHTELLI
ncbi:MAG TPA: alpha/beta fold hydrolase [Micromonosporaceae bacterium]